MSPSLTKKKSKTIATLGIFALDPSDILLTPDFGAVIFPAVSFFSGLFRCLDFDALTTRIHIQLQNENDT